MQPGMKPAMKAALAASLLLHLGLLATVASFRDATPPSRAAGTTLALTLSAPAPRPAPAVARQTARTQAAASHTEHPAPRRATAQPAPAPAAQQHKVTKATQAADKPPRNRVALARTPPMADPPASSHIPAQPAPGVSRPAPPARAPAPSSAQVNTQGVKTPGTAVTTLLRAALAPYFHYPRLAQRRGWEGTVALGLHITPEGRLRDIRVIRGSGHAVLDRAARQALARVGHLPAEEIHLPPGGLELVLPVEYRLIDS